jgi:hypothetical protein
LSDPDIARVRDALQAGNPGEPFDGAVITRFVAIAEWMTTAGGKWLVVTTGDAADEELATWDVQGFLFNLLHHPSWHHPHDDDDDDDDPDE